LVFLTDTQRVRCGAGADFLISFKKIWDSNFQTRLGHGDIYLKVGVLYLLREWHSLHKMCTKIGLEIFRKF